ncbi:type III secretion system translocon subunit SctE [Enterobacter ludwigii]|uniref:type III secretion system translocon subunit SctE n=1 Tax=Enterobacter ludwigii TaxID=299767 RepID=UPI0039758DE5
MTIENTVLQDRQRMSELKLTQNIPAQKMPQNKFSEPVLTADPEMLLKMSESVTDLARMEPPKLANSVLTILQDEAEQAAGDVSTDKQINNHTAKQVLLLAELSRLLAQSSESTILNNLNASIALMQATANAFKSVSSVYDGLVDDLKELKNQLSAAEEKYGKATEALKGAEEELESLQDERNHYEKDSDEYKAISEKIVKQQTVVDGKAVEARVAQENYNTITNNVLIMSVEVENKLAELMTAYDQLSFVQSSLHAETRDSAVGKYVELIATILNLIGKNNDKTIENQRKLTEMIHNERLKQIDNQATQITKKNSASGILKKIVGGLGIVFGAAISIVGVVAAVPTAGAASALTIAGCVLAFAGAALMVADAVMYCFSGFEKTVSGMLMEKLTDALTKAFVKNMIEKIDDLNRQHNPENAKEIAHLKNMTGNVLPLIAGIVSSIIVMIPSFLMIACTAGGALASTAGQLSKGFQTLINASVYATVTQTVATGALNIAASELQYQSTKIIADMKLTQNDIEHVNQMISILVEQLQKVSDEVLDINKSVLHVLKSRMDAVHYNLHNLRSAGLPA